MYVLLIPQVLGPSKDSYGTYIFNIVMYTVYVGTRTALILDYGTEDMYCRAKLN
jgi:hypothetical protein